MAENIATYILNLGGNLDEKLKRIGVTNQNQLAIWDKVGQQVTSANSIMQNMGRSKGK